MTAMPKSRDPLTVPQYFQDTADRVADYVAAVNSWAAAVLDEHGISDGRIRTAAWFLRKVEANRLGGMRPWRKLTIARIAGLVPPGALDGMPRIDQ